MHRQIAVYYEHPEWFRQLFSVLDKRGLPYAKIDAANHAYDPHENFAKKYSLFFNRMSASAGLRGNGNAVLYSRGLLASLEQQGVRVINGYKAFQIEISKALQIALFASLGIKSPKTRVINSADQALNAAKDLRFPIVVKPNIGGRGAGIIMFQTPRDLKTAVEQNLLDLGIDSTALVQEFAPKRGGHINRVETLGGKFLYAIKIYPEGESFNLCPAEVCQIDEQASGITTVGEICIADVPKTGLKIEPFEPPPEIIQTVERIVREGKIDVGGIEYLIDDHSGEPLFYDINALSNFVADAMNLIGFDPHENLVDFLQEEIKRCDTDTGCQSLAVG
jgi:glutathione synthase/RimK-type ligase-like ATP-grasp enzyme